MTYQARCADDDRHVNDDMRAVVPAAGRQLRGLPENPEVAGQGPALPC
ncbi:hypothetical protein L681_11825 [Stenotrophomonas maltophilia MF89]|nr:hypothetical protein L681_11825 [Stenotrophomonas maltophilia MF89]